MYSSTTVEEYGTRQCGVEGFVLALKAAASWLSANRERINSLNVFPVPDGDTGDNMLMTIQGGLKAIDALNNPSLHDICDALEEGTLNGSRGNSGVILSQIFSGFASGLSEADEIGVAVLSRAFQKAAEEGYKAHSQPVEGTIMTVARDIASKARELVAEPANAHPDLLEFLDELVAEARRSVARTQSILPRLRQAGVVDAGGEGLAVILDGVARHLRGESVDAADAVTPERHEFATLEGEEDDIYGYCTNFIVRGSDLDLEGFQQTVRSLGMSALVVGTSRHIKVHVHTERPGDLLTHALSLGSLHEIKIDNMDDQVHGIHHENLGREAAQTFNTALVAVVSGAGLEKLLRNDAKAVIVHGGQTLNPSTGEIARAIEQAPSDNVIVLPNNPNVVMSARKAAELSKKVVRVLPTRSVPLGITAALAYNPDGSLDSNYVAMADALADASSLEITQAVRDAEVEGVSVRAGEFLCFLDGQLAAAGNNLADVVADGLQNAEATNKELLTVYYGEGATPEQQEQISTLLTDRFPDLEIDAHEGGQPHYHLLASLE